MKLHEYKNAFEGAIVAAAQHFGIAEIYVEKDYWVTIALKQIFADKNSRDIAVFKGGHHFPSVSKSLNVFRRI